MEIDLKAANHTGRELELMLAGTKPLAMFYAQDCELPCEEFIPEKAFAPYVLSGRFVRADMLRAQKYPHRYVFFALPDEVWRIKAMTLLFQSFDQTSSTWNEALERIECNLLGYNEAETDAWCRFFFTSRLMRQGSTAGVDPQILNHSAS